MLVAVTAIRMNKLIPSGEWCISLLADQSPRCRSAYLLERGEVGCWPRELQWQSLLIPWTHFEERGFCWTYPRDLMHFVLTCSYSPHTEWLPLASPTSSSLTLDFASLLQIASWYYWGCQVNHWCSPTWFHSRLCNYCLATWQQWCYIFMFSYRVCCEYLDVLSCTETWLVWGGAGTLGHVSLLLPSPGQGHGYHNAHWGKQNLDSRLLFKRVTLSRLFILLLKMTKFTITLEFVLLWLWCQWTDVFLMQQCWADTRQPGAGPPEQRSLSPETRWASDLQTFICQHSSSAPALGHTDWITDYKTHSLSEYFLVKLNCKMSWCVLT